ncbi:MAG TPA: DUF87 domain-containing protein [Dehalococcoidia bacterium]|nr:DUF87 domain-containing protein [Dehalococcoidia bacterium]
MVGTTTTGLSLDAPVTLSLDDRRRHLHIIGKTGTGKSTLLYALMLQDLAAGRGFALLDPHGDLAQSVIDSVPPARTNDVLYLNPADLGHPVGFNLLENVRPDARALVTAHVVAAFKHVWPDSWGPRLEQILRNSIALLLDTPGSTLLGISRLLVDDAYRALLLKSCQNPMVRLFWTQQLAEWGDSFAAEAISPVQNKVDALLSPPVLRNIIGQPKSTLDLAAIMNGRRVLIANLSKAALGEGPAHLLGAFLATAFAQQAEARAAIPERDRVDFYLYADEFQNFATDSFATILSEARKWRLSLTLAHQFLDQLSPGLRGAVLGNVGSLIAFRSGAKDARTIAEEIGIENPEAVSSLPNFVAWGMLMRDGNPAGTQRIDMLEPHPLAYGRAGAIIARARARHARNRADVEERIARFLHPHHDDA